MKLASLPEFCSVNDFIIMNTWLEKLQVHLATWKRPIICTDIKSNTGKAIGFIHGVLWLHSSQELFYAWNVFQMTSKDPSLTKKYLALAQEELVIVKGGRGMQANCFMLSCLWVAEGHYSPRAKEKQLIASSSVCLFR